MTTDTWYAIEGDAGGVPIPRQVFYVKRTGILGFTGRPYAAGHLVLNINGLRVLNNQVLFLDIVNVYADSSGMLETQKILLMEDHGRHLVRLRDTAEAHRHVSG